MFQLVRIIFAAAVAVTFGFTWTVGQGSGLAQVNKNLCELWASLPLPAYATCEFQYVLVIAWLVVAFAVGIWLLVEICQLLGRIEGRNKRLIAHSLLVLFFLVGSVVSIYLLITEARKPASRNQKQIASGETPQPAPKESSPKFEVAAPSANAPSVIPAQVSPAPKYSHRTAQRMLEALEDLKPVLSAQLTKAGPLEDTSLNFWMSLHKMDPVSIQTGVIASQKDQYEKLEIKIKQIMSTYHPDQAERDQIVSQPTIFDLKMISFLADYVAILEGLSRQCDKLANCSMTIKHSNDGFSLRYKLYQQRVQQMLRNIDKKMPEIQGSL